jgi:hypothetical protein
VASSTPTYKEFRALVEAKQWSVAWLAQRCKANEPTKTVERILYHLAGTSWDEEPLPYPSLCKLYWEAMGEGTPEQVAASLPLMDTRYLLPMHEAQRAGRHAQTHWGWLALIEEHGWSVAEIAEAWGETIERVEAVIDELSMQPIPRLRQVPALAGTKEKAQQHRDVLRILHRQGQSVDALVKLVPYYSAEVMAKVVGQPLETEKARKWAKQHLPQQVTKPAVAKPGVKHGVCRCGCRRPVLGRQRYFTAGCKKKVQRATV